MDESLKKILKNEGELNFTIQINNEKYFQIHFNLFVEEVQLHQQNFIFSIIELEEFSQLNDREQEKTINILSERLRKNLGTDTIVAFLNEELIGVLSHPLENADSLEAKIIIEALNIPVRLGTRYHQFSYKFSSLSYQSYLENYFQMKERLISQLAKPLNY